MEGWPLSPFLNTGATIAVFQSDGILLWLMDAWNINVSAGVISLAVSFSRRAGILSGPLALCGFKLVKEFHDTIVVDYNRWYLWCRAHSHIWHVT